MTDPVVSEQTEVIDWTCGRCQVTASFMAGTVRPALPKGWIAEDDEVYCLFCRRERAAEALDISDEVPTAERTKMRSHARIEFEIRREPETPDNRIAKACRTSVVAVRKARARIGVPAAPLH